jgi:NADP-dependent aldehyde dehydrogenase
MPVWISWNAFVQLAGEPNMEPDPNSDVRLNWPTTPTFRAVDPKTGEPFGAPFPTSQWEDCDGALNAARDAAIEMEGLAASGRAAFLEAYAAGLETNAKSICEVAAQETGLPLQPRLLDIEMPRTIDQLRQAADAARSESWRQPEHDRERNIHSALGPIGPVFVLGPNNFPLAFNAISGGDFAAAIAAGNPVIGKAHPSHPGTSRLLYEQAVAAASQTGLPAAAVQMLYEMPAECGLKMAADPRLGAVAFTGSRRAGMALKKEADQVGKPIYLEMSSVNPVFLLGSAIARGADLVDEVATSCLVGAGQFCTCPNLIVMSNEKSATDFVAALKSAFESRPTGVLLSETVLQSLASSVTRLRSAGAELLTGGEPQPGTGYSFANTLMRVAGTDFLQRPLELQTEAFGPATLIVTCSDDESLLKVAAAIEGSLTAAIFGDQSQDRLVISLTRIARRFAGRVLHNRMPTGVAVSPAMNHGGPFPATGHPGFTAVGIPASLRRFAKLDCFENVPTALLPTYLQS